MSRAAYLISDGMSRFVHLVFRGDATTGWRASGESLVSRVTSCIAHLRDLSWPTGAPPSMIRGRLPCIFYSLCVAYVE